MLGGSNISLGEPNKHGKEGMLRSTSLRPTFASYSLQILRSGTYPFYTVTIASVGGIYKIFCLIDQFALLACCGIILPGDGCNQGVGRK